MAVYLVSLVLNVALNAFILVLAIALRLPEWPAVAAGFLVATAASAMTNFIGMRLIVFRKG
jgi:putative flippase GtrA